MDKKIKRGGMGLVSVLTLIFVVLKVLNLIERSWWWVLSPVWLSALCAAAVFSAVLVAGKLKKGRW